MNVAKRVDLKCFPHKEEMVVVRWDEGASKCNGSNHSAICTCIKLTPVSLQLKQRYTSVISQRSRKERKLKPNGVVRCERYNVERTMVPHGDNAMHSLIRSARNAIQGRQAGDRVQNLGVGLTWDGEGCSPDVPNVYISFPFYTIH